jgi:hypothetical protein
VSTRGQEAWEVGDRLHHEVFGEGVIVDILEQNEAKDLIVSFDEGSQRRIREGFTSLVRVEVDVS